MPNAAGNTAAADLQAWERDGYHFESGPSLYSGMDDRGVAANPLSHVFQAIDEPLPLIKYNKWNVILPEGEFLTRVGATQFLEVLQQVRRAVPRCVCRTSGTTC